MEIVVGGVVMVRGQLHASVEADSWTWTLGGGKLGLMMTKEAEAVWPASRMRIAERMRRSVPMGTAWSARWARTRAVGERPRSVVMVSSASAVPLTSTVMTRMPASA